MKNAEKLEQINQKISQLQKMQKQLENKYIENITKKIIKILIKKQAFKINKNILLNEIENLVKKLLEKNDNRQINK